MQTLTLALHSTLAMLIVEVDISIEASQVKPFVLSWKGNFQSNDCKKNLKALSAVSDEHIYMQSIQNHLMFEHSIELCSCFTFDYYHLIFCRSKFGDKLKEDQLTVQLVLDLEHLPISKAKISLVPTSKQLRSALDMSGVGHEHIRRGSMSLTEE